MSRNIVLVTIDSLRADACGFQGARPGLTPTLDEMATDGTVFETAIAPGSNTPSSMPVIFTGSHVRGVSHGVTNRETIRAHLAGSRTIPERLSARGFETIGFTSNPFTSRYFGFDSGFDEFTDFLRSERSLRNKVVSRWMEGRFVAGLRFGLNMIGRGDLSLTWEQYYDRVIDSVEAAGDPFFLWVFLLEPHWPYRPPGRYRDGSSAAGMYYHNWLRSKFSGRTPDDAQRDVIRGLYEGTVRHTDEFVGRLRSELSDRDPVLIVHGDHGEAFGEHGVWGHGHQLYEENVHVPLVVSGTGAGSRVEDPVSLRSLPRMIDDLAADDGRMDPAAYAGPWVTAHAPDAAAVRGRSWKYIHDEGGPELYDLDDDPGETIPTSNPELSALCERILDRERTVTAERHTIAGTVDDLGVAEL